MLERWAKMSLRYSASRAQDTTAHAVTAEVKTVCTRARILNYNSNTFIDRLIIFDERDTYSLQPMKGGPISKQIMQRNRQTCYNCQQY